MILSEVLENVKPSVLTRHLFFLLKNLWVARVVSQEVGAFAGAKNPDGPSREH